MKKKPNILFFLTDDQRFDTIHALDVMRFIHRIWICFQKRVWCLHMPTLWAEPVEPFVCRAGL